MQWTGDSPLESGGREYSIEPMKKIFFFRMDKMPFRKSSRIRSRSPVNKSKRRSTVKRRPKKRGGMPTYEEAYIAHERVLKNLTKDIKDTQMAVAKFQRKINENPEDSLLRAQMELLQDRLERLMRDYDDKSSYAIQYSI